jgi:hypothetical protein
VVSTRSILKQEQKLRRHSFEMNYQSLRLVVVHRPIVREFGHWAYKASNCIDSE